jgi:hypothetical protein
MLHDKENTIYLTPPEGEQFSSCSNEGLYCFPSKEVKKQIELTVEEVLERLADIIVEDYFDNNK